MLMLDTHALIWWTLKPERLSKRAREACEHIPSDGGFVSSISFWEIAVKVRKQTIDIGLPLGEFVSLTKSSNIAIIPVDEHTWMQSVDLQWPHRDPADRVIVAAAQLRKLPLVTIDRHIRKFYKPIIW